MPLDGDLCNELLTFILQYISFIIWTKHNHNITETESQYYCLHC